MKEDQKTCLRCGHKWTPQVKNPCQCPECHSPAWDKPRIRGMEGEE